jgi:hypothetical protein
VKLEIRGGAVKDLKQLDEKTNNGLEIRSLNSETAFLEKHV